MASLERIDRRTFLVGLGRRSGAALVLGTGFVACSSTSDGESASTTTVRSTTTGDATTTTVSESPSDETSSTTGPGEQRRWERVSFGFVSAYLLMRDGEAVLVDTGPSGGADRFDPALSALGIGWPEVRHVVLTHLHGDHVGGLAPVLDAAPDAVGYAGEADLSGIDSPRALEALVDGDAVAGLQIIHTPGHTPGHVSVFDPDVGVLVAGDALTGGDDGETVSGPNPEFTPDMATANTSAASLAGLDVGTILFGHGEPVVGGADALLDQLAPSL
ncbi:MAG: MBL fold metallo-hydrolase [Actinomycetota bacterium]|nr:MBL fold metallo-hydrolase [Actinomycetota bacterium]